MPCWVLFSGGDGYEENFATYKSVLLVASVLYFVSGVTFAVQGGKKKGHGSISQQPSGSTLDL
jgi:hypothetical protein